jgi:hypothetical protein
VFETRLLTQRARARLGGIQASDVQSQMPRR